MFFFTAHHHTLTDTNNNQLDEAVGYIILIYNAIIFFFLLNIFFFLFNVVLWTNVTYKIIDIEEINEFSSFFLLRINFLAMKKGFFSWNKWCVCVYRIRKGNLFTNLDLNDRFHLT